MTNGKRRIYHIPPVAETPPRALRSTQAASADAGTQGSIFKASQLQVGSPGVVVPVAGIASQGQIIAGDKIYPGTLTPGPQTSGGLYFGTGAPSNALGSNNDVYIRVDGTVAGNTFVYHKESGSWVALTNATSFPIYAPDGTIGAPSYSWTNDHADGWYRVGSHDERYVINGVDILKVTASGLSLPSSTGIIVPSTNGTIINAGTMTLTNDAGGRWQFNISGNALFSLNDHAEFSTRLHVWGSLFPASDPDPSLGHQTTVALLGGTTVPGGGTGSDGYYFFESDGKGFVRLSGTWTQVFGAGLTPLRVLFDHYADVGNSGSSETDLYSDTLAASQLGTNGHKIKAHYAGTFVNSTSTKQLKVYFGGTVIFDSGALTVSAASDWDVTVSIIRESSSVVRCSVAVNLTGASTGDFANYLRVTGLTLSNTQILKITGTAGGVGPASNDIVASMGEVLFLLAAGL